MLMVNPKRKEKNFHQKLSCQSHVLINLIKSSHILQSVQNVSAESIQSSSSIENGRDPAQEEREEEKKELQRIEVDYLNTIEVSAKNKPDFSNNGNVYTYALKRVLYLQCTSYCASL